MKIVHTGDWHVGKTLRGRSRSDEYRQILHHLQLFLRQEKVDILLIAGDLFDTFTPPAEAEDIVYNFLHQVSQMHIPIVIIAGNHDSSQRFTALANIMSLAGVTMVGLCNRETLRTVTVAGRDGNEASIAAVPFIPDHVFMHSSEQEQTQGKNLYSREMGKVLRQAAASLPPGTTHIVMAHLLMHGGMVGGGERQLYLGDNYAVHPDEITDTTDYLALGHLHLCQQIQAAALVYYCGSPLQLDFSERDKPSGFLLLETEPGRKCKATFVELHGSRKLKELTGTPQEIATRIAQEETLRNAYLKVTLTGDQVSLGMTHQMKQDFPNIVDIRRQYSATAAPQLATQSADWLPKFYQDFYRKQHNQEMPAALLTEFEALYQRCSQK
jgi:exonuclease SbcD